ncbi:hypothetical protein [Demetria terragena]|uniref:hypothetical protein n=1 Tax=Demetria terragena TaxID=63959 RepID=UPI0003611528|nr:hypothetical protein [Demetria terragena]
MSWTWTYADAAGAPVSGTTLVTSAFPTQSDAESWLGESWQDLADAGVAAVTLHENDSVVYGPMSLTPES